MNDKIAQSLGVTPLQSEQQPIVIQQTSVETDYQYARGQMITIIEKGSEALDDALNLAQQSQTARAYEVVSDLVKTLAQTNKDLLELMKQKKELEIDKDGPKTVNNNLFVGSSAELLALLKKQEKNG
jgi:hypothetical protein